MGSPMWGSACGWRRVGAPAPALGADLQTKPNLSGRFANGLLLSPADGKRSGLLDRVEMLIEVRRHFARRAGERGFPHISETNRS
jgi:hypothetical protein